MKRVPRNIVKQRSREISALVESWTESHASLIGSMQRCTVVDVAADGESLVGHTKGYVQLLLPKEAPDGTGSILGCVVEARCLSATRWSLKGEVIRVIYRPDQPQQQAWADREQKSKFGVSRQQVFKDAIGTSLSASVSISNRGNDPIASEESSSTNVVFERNFDDDGREGKDLKDNSSSSSKRSRPSKVSIESTETASKNDEEVVAAASADDRHDGVGSSDTLNAAQKHSSDVLLHNMTLIGIIIALSAVLVSGIMGLLR